MWLVNCVWWNKQQEAADWLLVIPFTLLCSSNHLPLPSVCFILSCRCSFLDSNYEFWLIMSAPCRQRKSGRCEIKMMPCRDQEDLPPSKKAAIVSSPVIHEDSRIRFDGNESKAIREGRQISVLPACSTAPTRSFLHAAFLGSAALRLLSVLLVCSLARFPQSSARCACASLRWLIAHHSHRDRRRYQPCSTNCLQRCPCRIWYDENYGSCTSEKEVHRFLPTFLFFCCVTWQAALCAAQGW